MADAYNRAYDPSRVPQIEARMSENAALRGIDMSPDSHRDLSFVHGFTGPAKNGVRLRPQEPGSRRSTYQWVQSPADYNETSTALTNRAKSGAIVKDAEARAEVNRKFPSEYAKKNKQAPIKINTDPAKGK